MKPDDLIYVAGHTGLIGSALVRKLRGENQPNLLLATHAELELTDPVAVRGFFDEYKPAYVFLAAGRVGGIVENQTFPADFLNANLAIQLNVLAAAHRSGVRKLILFGSSCMYPRECPQPMPEEFLLSGKPEPTSMAYAISKLAGVQLCLAYNQQFGEQRFIPVIPNSAYGPNDNFDPRSGHVLSVLIHRFHEAKLGGSESITLWGSGNPRREFVHADDIADACMRLMHQDGVLPQLPLNIGAGTDYSIRELAEAIAEVIGYKGMIQWDTTKPDGAPRKLLDSSRMHKLGWKASTTFADGLKNTYEWYLANAS